MSATAHQRAAARGALAFAAALAAASLGAAPLAPNAVEITPKLVTSGQPSRATLAKLRAEGFGAVIYLAPPTVHDAVQDEAAILDSQSIAFVNIPIDFGRPTEADYEAFALQMKKLGDRKVLVHCEVNLRASSMVFLYRVIEQKQDPHKAYADVSSVWVPNGTWKRYIRDMLQKRGITFESY
jgi:protein tyrosine phosphatase (PTP) superfamily phosphohydrolase (DUF442 family)